MWLWKTHIANLMSYLIGNVLKYFQVFACVAYFCGGGNKCHHSKVIKAEHKGRTIDGIAFGVSDFGHWIWFWSLQCVQAGSSDLNIFADFVHLLPVPSPVTYQHVLWLAEIVLLGALVLKQLCTAIKLLLVHMFPTSVTHRLFCGNHQMNKHGVTVVVYIFARSELDTSLTTCQIWFSQEYTARVGRQISQRVDK